VRLRRSFGSSGRFDSGPPSGTGRRCYLAAVVLEDASLQRLIDILADLVLRRAFDGVAVRVDQQFLVAPVDTLRPGRCHQHLAAGQPVPRVDDEEAQAPVAVVDQEVLHMTYIAVAGGDVVSGDL